MSKKYTHSLNQKARLRGDLETWLGRRLSEQEVEEGFDLEKMLNSNCQIQVQHNVSDKGNTFANIQTIVPLGKGMTKLEIEDYVRKQDRASTNGKEKEVPDVEPDF